MGSRTGRCPAGVRLTALRADSHPPRRGRDAPSASSGQALRTAGKACPERSRRMPALLVFHVVERQVKSYYREKKAGAQAVLVPQPELARRADAGTADYFACRVSM